MKANEKYSDLARFGIQYFCQIALLELREKLNASGFEAVAYLYRRVWYNIEDFELEMAERLLDGEDLAYYKSVHL